MIKFFSLLKAVTSQDMTLFKYKVKQNSPTYHDNTCGNVHCILDIGYTQPYNEFHKQKDIQQASAGVLHISHNNSDTGGLLSAQERQKRIELMQSHTALHFFMVRFS